MIPAFAIVVGALAMAAGLGSETLTPPLVLEDPFLGIGRAYVSDYYFPCETAFMLYIERSGPDTWRAVHRFSPACTWSPAFTVYYPFYPALLTLRGDWEQGFTWQQSGPALASIAIGPYGDGTAIMVQGYFEAASAYGYVWQGTMADTRVLTQLNLLEASTPKVEVKR